LKIIENILNNRNYRTYWQTMKITSSPC